MGFITGSIQRELLRPEHRLDDERNPAMDDRYCRMPNGLVIRENLAMGQGEAIAAATCWHDLRWVDRRPTGSGD
jgi:hypothetical protein